MTVLRISNHPSSEKQCKTPNCKDFESTSMSYSSTVGGARHLDWARIHHQVLLHVLSLGPQHGTVAPQRLQHNRHYIYFIYLTQILMVIFSRFPVGDSSVLTQVCLHCWLEFTCTHDRKNRPPTGPPPQTWMQSAPNATAPLPPYSLTPPPPNPCSQPPGLNHCCQVAYF